MADGKKELSSRQRTELGRIREERDLLSYRLRSLLTSHNPLAGKDLTLYLNEQKRIKKRHVPLCHMMPTQPGAVFFNVPVSEFWNDERILTRPYLIGTTCTEFLDTHTLAFACVEYDAVTNIGSLMEFLLNYGFGKEKKELELLYKRQHPIVWSSQWLIQPKYRFNVCDLAAVPDKQMLQELPECVVSHISRFNLQPFFDENNANGTAEREWRIPNNAG